MTRPPAHLVNPLASTPRTRGHVTAPIVNAYSSRGSGRGPLLHASPYPPVPSTTGATYRAACGAQVRNITRQPWAPSRGVGRYCPACSAAVEKTLKPTARPADE